MGYCFSKPFEFSDEKKSYYISIKKFDILINNHITIKVESDCRDEKVIKTNLNIMLASSESYPNVTYFDSANDFIIESNNQRQAEYKIFSDTEYLKWALEKHDSFFLDKNCFDAFHYIISNVFCGITLNDIQDSIKSISDMNDEDFKRLFIEADGQGDVMVEKEFIDSLKFQNYSFQYEVNFFKKKSFLKYSESAYLKKAKRS